MKIRYLSLTAAVLSIVPGLHAQDANPDLKLENFPQKLRGDIRIPASSIERLEDIGKRYHTNHWQLLTPNSATPQGETPASLRAVYNVPSTGGSNVIVIVDAYDYANALSDFNTFATQFGLPTETSSNAFSSNNKVFQVVYASGSKPNNNTLAGKILAPGWNLEASLDIQWAHAMAPKAKIILMECNSSSNNDLGKGIQVANTLANVKEVSMSFGGSETASETSSDNVFSKSGIVYVCSSGDTGGAIQYPAASPKVVAVGGTTLNRNGSGVFTSETGWADSGGGSSAYEARPSYQNAISSIVGSKRGVPDCSLDADPNSGASVYNTVYGGWVVVGGTSFSAPAMAGIINLCGTANGNFANSSADELTRIYSNLGTVNYRDIVTGTAGSFSCKSGWDFVTGVGSTITTVGK